MPGPDANRLTREHRATLSAIVDDVARRVRELAARADTSNIDGWFARIVKDLVALLAAAWRTILELTGFYVQDHAALEGRTVEPELAEWVTEQVMTSLRVTGPVAFKQAITAGKDEGQARDAMASRMSGAAERLVLGAERDTVMATAESSPEIVGWRRVPDDDPCAWCAMLVSRGAVYLSRASATSVVGRRGRARGSMPLGASYHDFCQCTAEPLYESEEEPAEVDDLYRQWLEVTSGKSGDEALRAWREYWDNRQAGGTQQEARRASDGDRATGSERAERLAPEALSPERQAAPSRTANPNPAVLTGSRVSGWQHAIPNDTGEDAPIPVRDFEIANGYKIKSGKAYRIDGITYIVEDGTPISDERVLREFRSVHGMLPGATDIQQGYAWLAGANPADSYWAERYRMPNFRSFATAGDGAVRIWDRVRSPFGPDSYRNELKHEFGHNVSAAAQSQGLHDRSDAWDEAARQDTRAARPTDFKFEHFGHPINLTPNRDRPWPYGVTSYGTSSPGEDYAESVDLYLSGKIGMGRLTPGGPLVPIYFRDLFPARARILDRIFPAIGRAQLERMARDRG
jgi:hypothetical protein